ncbi:MAG: sulfite exporter TauE/SafE family protein [Gammaproteobacteria bacterium]|nr:sulfite exporter TauE/SafE family protein [Gammaproteobacteria bacterium]
MISEPLFYAATVPAILIFGISKGGFGGGLGVLAIPLMALVMSPLQAAAILLPILCLMDLFGLWAYRGKWIATELRILVPASLLGIGVGTLLFEYMSPAVVRLLLGIVALSFTLQYWLVHNFRRETKHSVYPASVGILAAGAAGFTSFIAHAGAPPLNMYLLRRGMDRSRFVGTSVVFFAVVNYVKLVPYAWLGQFDRSNLYTALVLSPLAPIGIGAGVWLHNRVSDRFFFRFVYVLLFVVGIKLIYDGISGL